MNTSRVGEVVEELTGTKPSPSTASRVLHTLESEFADWKTRALATKYAYAFADGTYFSVIYDGQMVKNITCPFWPWSGSTWPGNGKY